MKPRWLTPEQQQAVDRVLARRRRLTRRRNWRDEDLPDPGPRCPVCGLLEPHECLDGAQVVRS
jgi:hypothetical protein